MKEVIVLGHYIAAPYRHLYPVDTLVEGSNEVSSPEEAEAMITTQQQYFTKVDEIGAKWGKKAGVRRS